jgi:hypothetical protein
VIFRQLAPQPLGRIYYHRKLPVSIRRHENLNNIMPYEAYTGHKPDVSHLREIGCRAFVLIQNKHNPKVFERSEECCPVVGCLQKGIPYNL